MPEPTPPNPDQPDGGEGNSGAPDGDKNKQELISKAEALDAFRARDAERDKRKKLQTDFDAYKSETANQLAELQNRLREIEDAKLTAEEESARKAGDIDKLQKTWEGQRSELQRQLEAERKAREKEVSDWLAKHDSLAKKYHSNLVEKTLLEELDALSTRPKAEIVFLLKDYQFEAVEDDDGRFVGIKAKDSDKTIADLHKEVCEKYGLPFEKNDRANGSGAQPTNGSDGASPVPRMPANWSTMSKEDRQKWFAKNPTYKLG